MDVDKFMSTTNAGRNAMPRHSRWVECITHGRRARRYRVRFVGDEAVAVQVRVVRGPSGFWRDCWHRHKGPPTLTAACAIRAALVEDSKTPNPEVERLDRAHGIGAQEVKPARQQEGGR